jgi:BspA type Leucine rich repeat region (6 copies)
MNAFQFCSSISSISIGAGVTSIGNFAFGDTAITTLIIPDSVLTIGNYICSYCEYLSSVTIGSRVTSIGEGAFWYTAVTAITLPASLTSVGTIAFPPNTLILCSYVLWLSSLSCYFLLYFPSMFVGAGSVSLEVAVSFESFSSSK